MCLVCNKIRHIAVNCLYRYDKSYTGSNHNAKNNKRENHNAFIVSPTTIKAMNCTLIVELAIM